MGNKDNSNSFWWVVRAGVVTGLVLAAVTTSWLTDTLHYWKSAAQGLWTGLSATVIWLFTTWLYLPVLLILLLCMLSIWKAWDILMQCRKGTEAYKTSFERYTEDTIYNAVWTWSYFGGRVFGLKPRCPRDSTPMVCCYEHNFNGDEYNWFLCEHCGIGTNKIKGSTKFYIESISRQIEGRINRKEYLQKIAKLGKLQ